MEYKEILKLKSMLEKAKIPFQFRVWLGGYQIGYPHLPPDSRFICSVVEHPYSYGNKKDLLEIMGLTTNGNDVEGYLSARKVFNRIKKHYKGVSK